MVATEEKIEQLIVNRILSGTLPVRASHSVFGGKGDGSHCACCELPITRDEIQYDVEFSAARGTVAHSLSMHLLCYSAWANTSDGIDRALTEARMATTGAHASGKRVFFIAYSYELLVKRAAVLWAEGYRVLCALGNAAAKATLEGSGRRYDLFIIGTAAAEQPRLEMARWLEERFPGVLIVALNPADAPRLADTKYNASDDSPEQWLPVVAHAASGTLVDVA